MKTIANRRDYLDAVTDYAREWQNEVVITDGVHTETYTSCEIKITTPFSQDALSMGQSFTKELDLTIKQPERTLIYNLATIKVYSKLKVGEEFISVQMGEYFPSEVTTNDDYFSLNIKAYDMMGKLDVPYVPNYTNVYDMSCESKLYYVEDGELQSFPAGRSLPSIRTGGDLTFVNNSEITAWICAKVDGVWVGRTMFDDTTGKLEPNQTLTISCSEYIVSFTERYYGGITVNGQDLAPMTTLGVIIDMSRQFSFLNSAFYEVEIDTIYEGTCAEILGWFAGMSGKNAVFNDEGRLVFKWYTIATREGGRWLDYPVTWATVENKSWADTTSQIVGMNITRTEQKERGANLNEGEFTIASITSGTEENPLTVGEGKGISFENPYMTEERLTVIGNRELGKKTAVGTVQTFGNPLLEVGDTVGVIDKEGLAHTFFISNMEWNLTGGCSCVLTAIGNADAEIEFSNVSPMEKKITKVKSVLQGVVERFSNLINSLVGYYTITEENGVPTGWTIKDDLNNPVNMIKCSLGGIGISSNGGQTYKTAITGEGIVADTITSGILRLGGLDDDTILEIYNTQNTKIGTWNSEGLNTYFNQVYKQEDYSEADRTRIRSIIMGTITPTQEDYEKYDFNGDGRIGARDYIICGNILSRGDLTIAWSVGITPASKRNALWVQKSETYASDPIIIAETVFNVGVSGVSMDGNKIKTNGQGEITTSGGYFGTYFSDQSSSARSDQLLEDAIISAGNSIVDNKGTVIINVLFSGGQNCCLIAQYVSANYIAARENDYYSMTKVFKYANGTWTVTG